MAQAVCVIPGLSDRRALKAVVADRNRPKKRVKRAQAVLAAAGHDPEQRVALRLGVNRARGLGAGSSVLHDRSRLACHKTGK